jgi:hypothetical protein
MILKMNSGNYKVTIPFSTLALFTNDVEPAAGESIQCMYIVAGEH